MDQTPGSEPTDETVTEITAKTAAETAVDSVEELLVEEISIDGMCGVY